MSRKLQSVFGWCLFLILFSFPSLVRAGETDRPNVLLIIADDLRPNLGCYDYPAADTPNIDRLADKGLLFQRAYCQIPACSPSRSSFLTGLRPDTVKVYDNSKHFRKNLPDVVTLPQYFKNHGYHTRSLGKVFHGEYLREIHDDPPSWSKPPWRPIATQYLTDSSLEILRKRFPKDFDGSRPLEEVMNLHRFKGPAWEAPNAGDTDLTDGRIAERAVSLLGELKSSEQPFFLAVGFVKPHAPFVAPARYFDQVRRSAIELPGRRTLPDGAPRLAHTSTEINGYYGVPQDEVFSDEVTRELIQAYDACVAYVDAQVGSILDELDRQGLRENTIVVFLSDHGYHLGEVGQWCKNTSFEESLRVPLIISDARAAKTAGQKCEGIVELVDLYPTLAALCGLPEPKGVEGASFHTLLDSPQQAGKKFALSQHSSNLRNPRAPVGYSVATADFRYTRWQNSKGEMVAEELYKIAGGRTASANLINDARHVKTAKQLRKIFNSRAATGE